MDDYCRSVADAAANADIDTARHTPSAAAPPDQMAKASFTALQRPASAFKWGTSSVQFANDRSAPPPPRPNEEQVYTIVGRFAPAPASLPQQPQTISGALAEAEHAASTTSVAPPVAPSVTKATEAPVASLVPCNGKQSGSRRARRSRWRPEPTEMQPAGTLSPTATALSCM